LEEAIAMQPRMACHQLLVVILLTDEVAKPHLLWDQFKAELCDDVKHKLHHMNHYQADQEIPEDNVYDYSLWDLNRILVGIGRSLVDFSPMPLPQQQWAHRIPNPLLQGEQYDIDEMATLVDEQRAIFNPDQATAFDAVLESVTNNHGHFFFIHAAGGYGKTFLCNTIAAEVRRRGWIALYMVSSRIAALLLDGERTSYSHFKIPLLIHKDSVTRLKRNSYMFPVLQQTKVIIWDKVPMQHKYDINTVDQCLRDLLEVSNHLHLIALELTYYLE